MRSLLEQYRHARNDPTTIVDHDSFWRATWTPEGPGTIRIVDPLGEQRIEHHGPGGAWLAERAPNLLGAGDEWEDFECVDRVVADAKRRFHPLRLGRSASPYHELIPAVLGQRVTGLEAARQWRTLVMRHGELAPGPLPDLRLPPDPETLGGLHHTTLHNYGIERRRAEALRHVGQAGHFLISDWSTSVPPSVHTSSLTRIPGVGIWTAAVAGAVAFGDPDALAVGDYHLKNLVAWALRGRPRGTDEEMLETLAPYAGQRHRVVRWLQLAGHRPPARGPRRPIIPITQL